MRGEGRNVSRPVEFSAARPLLADKAGRAKSGLQAASPESTPQARSPQPRALRPRVAAAPLPSPRGKKLAVLAAPRTAETGGLATRKKKKKKQNRKGRQTPARALEAPRRGSALGQGWRCGERKRQRCHRRGPFVTVTLPSPASTPPPPPPSPGWQKFAKSRRPGCRAPRGARPVRLTSARAPARPAPAHLSTGALARPPAAPTAAR